MTRLVWGCNVDLLTLCWCYLLQSHWICSQVPDNEQIEWEYFIYKPILLQPSSAVMVKVRCVVPGLGTSGHVSDAVCTDQVTSDK